MRENRKQDTLNSHYSIVPNFLGKLFSRVTELRVSEDGLVISHTNKEDETLLYSNFVNIPSLYSSVFGITLYFETCSREYRLRFLNRRDSRSAFLHIKKCVLDTITAKVCELDRTLVELTKEQYLRDSNIAYLDKKLIDLLDRYNFCKDEWDTAFDSHTIQAIKYFSQLSPLEQNKEYFRETYEKSRLETRVRFYDEIESNPLTFSQRKAVVRNNDRNLVLAAAGTGKTSVMVAKCLDLIDSGDCSPKEILVLAYNSSAARELEDRILTRADSVDNLPRISTFHALGRNILSESKITTYLSDFVEDPKRLQMWITDWISDYISSSPKAMRDFIELSYQPMNPFDFANKAEYDLYVRDNEFRTLQGERVKGYQELLIANWLFLNSVDYDYEAPYVTKRRLEVGFDYRPDFRIKDTNIYIEHFGIDRDGNTRADIDKEAYALSMTRKRELHAEKETILLETYHYDWYEGNLENRLAKQLNQLGVEARPKPHEEIFQILKKLGLISDGATRYLKCLQAIRTERLDRGAIKQRLDSKMIVNSEKYSDFLDALHSSYVLELSRQNRIDFDDMIIRAVDCLNDGKFVPEWKHILVDEFQDISSARMKLIESLIDRGPNPILTVVGDDWQSIYRFAGGKLELTTRFGDYFGNHTVTVLDKTFRYNSSIADIAGLFVMQNPEQYRKRVVTAETADEPQVYLLDSGPPQQKLLADRAVAVVKTIRKNDSIGSIAILARYNYLIDDVKALVRTSGIEAGVKYWTFHGSKGLEADYCILIGFFQGKVGFPNDNKDEAVLEALLPSLDSYPYSEERRLFYVALTRARKKSYIIADPLAPSQFINELLSPKYKIHIVSEAFAESYRTIFKCPLCEPGYFRLISGKYNNFYSCTSGSVCRAKPRTCTKCEAPSIDHEEYSICNNARCREHLLLCKKCGRPMKLREGRYGKFYGCTGYGIKDDKCTATRQLSSMTA